MTATTNSAVVGCGHEMITFPSIILQAQTVVYSNLTISQRSDSSAHWFFTTTRPVCLVSSREVKRSRNARHHVTFCHVAACLSLVQKAEQLSAE
jgi:hypothetical protein